MTAVDIWIRRSTAAKALPALMALAVVVLFSRDGWQYEWGWGLEQTGTAASLLSVTAAGLAAHDRARLAHPTLVPLARTAPRGPRGLLLMSAGTLVWHLVAWLVAVAIVVARVSVHGPGGAPDWLELLRPAVALAAGTALGAFTGALLPNLAAGPVAAAVTYLLALLGPRHGLTGLFTPGGTVGTLIGVRMDPVIASGEIAVHLALVAACSAAVVALTSIARWPRGLAAATAVLLLAVCVVHGRQSERALYVDDGRGTTCVGTGVVFCGPADGATVLRLTQRSLADAIDRLAPSGIPWQTRYRWEDGPVDPTGSGVVSVSPETFVDDRLPADQIALALGRPRTCAGFDDPLDDALLDDASLVVNWVTHVLDAPVVPRAPAEVRTAYAALSTCPLATDGARS